MESLESIATGDLEGAWLSVGTQLGGALQTYGFERAGAAVAASANIGKIGSGVKDLYNVSKNLGQVERRIGELVDRTATDGGSFLNKLPAKDTIYGNVVTKPLQDGVRAAFQSGTTAIINSASGGGGSNPGSSRTSTTNLSFSVVGAGSYATSLNSLQSNKTASTPAVIKSSGGGVAAAVTNTISKGVNAVSNAASKVTNAISSAIGKVTSFFGGKRK